MTIAAADSDYEVELYMPERRIAAPAPRTARRSRPADPSADLKVDFILMTDPGKTHYGNVVRRQSDTTEPHEEHGNMVRIRVQPDEQITDRRPGATVTANVHCGKRAAGCGPAARGLGMARSQRCFSSQLWIGEVLSARLQRVRVGSAGASPLAIHRNPDHEHPPSSRAPRSRRSRLAASCHRDRRRPRAARCQARHPPASRRRSRSSEACVTLIDDVTVPAPGSGHADEGHTCKEGEPVDEGLRAGRDRQPRHAGQAEDRQGELDAAKAQAESDAELEVAEKAMDVSKAELDSASMEIREKNPGAVSDDRTSQIQVPVRSGHRPGQAGR